MDKCTENGFALLDAILSLGLLLLMFAESAFQFRRTAAILKQNRNRSELLSEFSAFQSAPSKFLTAKHLNFECSPIGETSDDASINRCKVTLKNRLPGEQNGPEFIKRSPFVIGLGGGFTLIEVIVTLGLAVLVFSASFPVLKSDSKLKKQTEIAVAAEIDLTFVEAQITSAIQRANRFCFFRGAFVFDKRGGIDPASDAVGTGIGVVIPAHTIAFHRPAAVTQTGIQSEPLCSHRLWDSTIDGGAVGKIQYWLAISVDGITILTGDVTRSRNRRTDCAGEVEYRGVLIPSRAILDRFAKNAFPQDARSIAKSAAVYLPLKDGFVIFVDDDKVLRRVSLITKENAPLLPAIEAFTARQLSPGYIEISIVPKTGIPRNFKIPSAATCEPYEALG